MSQFPSFLRALTRFTAFMFAILGGMAVAVSFVIGEPVIIEYGVEDEPEADLAFLIPDEEPDEEVGESRPLWQPENFTFYEPGVYRTLGGGQTIIVFDIHGDLQTVSDSSFGPGIATVQGNGGWVDDRITMLRLENTSPLLLTQHTDAVFAVGVDLQPGDVIIAGTEDSGWFKIRDPNYEWIINIEYEDMDTLEIEEGWGFVGVSGSVLGLGASETLSAATVSSGE